MKKGVDARGTFIKVLWEDGRRGKIYVRDISQNREAFIKRLREVIKDGKPSRVGVAVAGFTSLEGVVHRSPNIPAPDGVDVGKFWRRRELRGLL
jgi:glucokinase